MSRLTDYFARRAVPVQWHAGDRVQGQWQGVPFIGTVAVEHLVSEAQGSEVTVFLDLPIVLDNQTYRQVTVKPQDLKSRN